MITPVFEIDQEEEFVVVKLRAPHIKVQSFDFYVEGSTFKFFGHPYFLRLVFSSELVEDGREKASYDVDSGIVTVLLPKKVSLSSLYASLWLEQRGDLQGSGPSHPPQAHWIRSSREISIP